MIFVLEEATETILNFSNNHVKVLQPSKSIASSNKMYNSVDVKTNIHRTSYVYNWK